MPKVALFLNDGCFASTVHGMIDALSCATYAAREIGQDISFETTICSLDGKDVQSSNGHNIAVTHALDALGYHDVIIIVPWLAPDVAATDVAQMMEPMKASFDQLKHKLSEGTILASSCTGSFLLAEAGLLDGKFATTHWRAADVFRDRYPDVVLQAQDLITDNGSLMCGGGAASHLDLTLHIIRRFSGEDLASHCAHTLVVDPGRNLQSPYAMMHIKTDHGDMLVSKTQNHIAQHFSDQISVQGLADQLSVSERTLARRFKGATDWPIGLYIQSIRIEAARNKLATTAHSLQAIVAEVGYEDFSSFARLFKNKVGLTMQSYRERFRA